jgi:hypothetical protein
MDAIADIQSRRAAAELSAFADDMIDGVTLEETAEYRAYVERRRAQARRHSAGNAASVKAAAGAGGELSNTPPATLQNVDSGAPTTGGEDWLEVMLYVQWDHSRWHTLTTQLDAAQRASENPKAKGEDFVRLPGSGGLWRVHSGCSLGGAKGNGPRCRWRIERDGIMFGLVNRPDPHKTLPSGFVRITGDVLTALGDAEAAWQAVIRWVYELGGKIVRNALSRVDACVDLPGVGVDELVTAFMDGRVIRRTRKATVYTEARDGKSEAAKPIDELFWEGRVKTGLRCGSGGGGSMLRIYDKARECKDISTRAWVTNRRWGGVDQDKAVRVEWQMRREFLTAEKCRVNAKTGELHRPAVDTVEDWFEKRAQLLDWMMSEYTRFVKPFDRRHTERAEDLDVWKEARRRFKQWADTHGGNASLKPLQRGSIDVSSLQKQARGVLESIAARLHVPIDSPDDLLGFANTQLWEVIEMDTDIRDRVRNRIAAQGLTPVVADMQIVIADDEFVGDEHAPF